MVACFMVLVGVAMLSPGLLDHFVLGPGAVVIIISAIFIAGQIVWVERPAYAENRAGVVTLLMFAILAGMFAAGYLTTGVRPGLAVQLFDTPMLMRMMLAMVLLCTVVNYWIMNAWQRVPERDGGGADLLPRAGDRDDFLGVPAGVGFTICGGALSE